MNALCETVEWTEERVEELKALSARGLSAGQIAERLGGVSRNAVIGKLHRLQRPGAAAAPTRQRPTQAVRRAPIALAPARPRFAAPTLIETAPNEQGGVSFLGLTGEMCRWPIGDPSSNAFGFCGAAAHAGPYCSGHAQKAYLPRGGPRRAYQAIAAS